MPIFDNIMVDIETTGLSPDRNAVIQIAAVRFSLDPQDVDTKFFNQCLSIPPTRFWDEGTRAWWSKMPETIDGIYAKMRDPRVVMEEFYQWCMPFGGARFWSKPLSFDYPFIQSYFNEFGFQMPFKHWEGRDLRSFLAGKNFPYSPFDDKSVPFEGEQHNGLFDTLHQIKILFTALNTAPERIIDAPD